VKQKTKGILAFAFLGGILLTSTVMFALPPPDPTMTAEEVAMEEQGITKTGTLMDNFVDSERSTFCGTKMAQSNSYVKEFEIPTVCTQPLAIKVGPNGMVWFAETNSGDIGMFDPNSESFIEFENNDWPEGARSMIWGMDYSSDGSIWYTDPTFDSIWRFDTVSAEYNRLEYPSSESLSDINKQSMPQRLKVIGSNIFVNDFTGGKITVLDIAQGVGGEVVYTSIQSPLSDGFTSDFVLDRNNNLWYTNWIPESSGALIKFDLLKYTDTTQDSIDDVYLEEFVEFYEFPNDLNTANGISTDSDGNIWIADTSSSYFFKFDQQTEEFTKYITSKPAQSNYGNYSGVIKSPISRPYWMLSDDNNIIFNEQTSNRIGIFDTEKESLVEYSIPSKNPGWADCGDIEQNESNLVYKTLDSTDCGVAQVFGFDIEDDKIWFSEWAENKIGVINTSKELPISVDVDTNLVSIKKGEKSTLNLTLTYSNSLSPDMTEIVSSNTAPYQSFSYISTSIERNKIQNNQETIEITIYANEKSLPGEYKLLLGVQTDEVVVSKFIDIIIES